MDPLSISAGIIAFISAANSLLLLCYKTQAELRHTSWALVRLIKEIQDLRNLVESVRVAASTSEGQQANDQRAASVELYKAMEVPLKECMNEVCALDKKLRIFSSNGHDSKLKNVVQAVKWTTHQKDVERFLANIDRCKGALTLCISSQNL